MQKNQIYILFAGLSITSAILAAGALVFALKFGYEFLKFKCYI